ncbi:MAG: hypothetical protein V5A57_03675, partial [Candidatus Paceibacterota bacterium]
DDGSITTTSATWSFTTNYAPDNPINPSPPDEADLASSSTTTLSTYVDDDGDSLITNFYLDGAQKCSSSSVTSGTRISCDVAVTPGNSYSWYATAEDQCGAVTTSSTWNFDILTTIKNSLQFDGNLKFDGNLRFDQGG